MTKPEWGLKRICPSCSTRYYDMKKKPPVCPNCGTVFDPESVLKVRRRATADDKRKQQAQDNSPEEDIDDIEPGQGKGEEAVIEDAGELGDEEAELEDVVEIEDEDAEADR